MDGKNSHFQILQAEATEFREHEKNLVDLLLSQSLKYQDKTAFVLLEDGENESTRITYREMLDQAKAIAVHLQKSGIEKGDRVILLFPAGIDFIVSLFGCLFAGVIAVPAYAPRRNRNNERFWAILKDSGAKSIITTEHLYQDFQKNFKNEPGISDVSFNVFHEICEGSSDQWRKPGTMPDDLALLQYTSGSTGWPKGVMVSHANLIHNSEVIRQSFNHDENLVGVNWLPPFHDMGLIGTLIQPLYVGGMNVIIPPNVFLRDPSLWLKAISNYKGTTVGGPNFALDYCCDRIGTEELKGLDLSSIKVLFCGAEPVYKDSLKRFSEHFQSCGFRSGMFYPCYGLAESTLMVTGGDYSAEPVFYSASGKNIENNNRIEDSRSDEDERVFVSCGHPWVGSNVRIVNPESNTMVERDEIGEIWTSGRSICRGYWNNEEETAKTFRAYTADTREGPFMRTGDLGFTHNGQLYVTGRLKDMIIIRGQNHYPQDIEKTVESCHESLREYANAIFSVNVAHEERLVIVQEVERTHLRSLNETEVFETIREVVAGEHEIQVYSIVLIRTGSILKTTSGKIQRRAIKKAYLEDKLNTISSWELDLEQEVENIQVEASLESVQNWLINWMSMKLKINPEDINPDKSILAYGLDSLAAVELEREVNQQFGIEWSVADFLQDNKISDLAKEGLRLLREKKS